MNLDTVTLGARVFELCDLDAVTFAQSQWLAVHAERVGLDAVWPRDGESDDAYERRLRRKTVMAADIPALLAGYLVDPETLWSKRRAEVIQRYLELLTDPADHEQMAIIAARVAPDFFGRALALFGISLISSTSAPLSDQRQRSVAH